MSRLPAAVAGPTDALDSILGRAVLEPARQVFVNRNMRMDHVKLVGFDMDYTLLPYSKRSIEELSFRLTAEKLVRNHGYSEAILGLQYDPDFVVRGLLVDKRRGNIMKMDTHGHIGRVYHGRRMLSKEARREQYRNEKVAVTSPRYHWIDTLFALPEGVLYAEIIDYLELVEKRTDIDYAQLFELIRAAIDECHRDESLKSIIKANPQDFVEQDPDLPYALHKLRSSGKRLFVLTNSLWDYTQRMMSFLLDGKLAEYPSWMNYFDLVITGADKPRFFTDEREFHEVDRRTGQVSAQPTTRFDRQHVYQGGSLIRLDQLLGVQGEQVLYVGDHIYGDIIRSKKDTLWRTALILSELEDELRLAPKVAEARARLGALEEKAEHLEDDITSHRLKVAAVEQALDDRAGRGPEELAELVRTRRMLRVTLDQRRRELRDLIDERDQLETDIDAAYNVYWGSVFKEGSENSRFGRQVEYYSCVYTSRVSNFLYYSPTQYFRSPRHWMPHEKT